MEQREIVDQSPPQEPSPDERRKLKAALRQLEWAATYLFAFENLELADAELNRSVDDIQVRLVTAELRLERLLAS